MKRISKYTPEALKSLSENKAATTLDLGIDKKQDFSTLPVFEYVNSLTVYAEVATELQLLEKFPNVEKLWLMQKFTEAVSVSHLKKLKDLSVSGFRNVEFSNLEEVHLEKLSVSSCSANERFSRLLSGSISRLYMSEIKKAESIDFIANVPNLEYLTLNEFSLTALPDFSSLPKLKLLFMYGMHKTNDINSLIDSSVEYLHICLSGDKIGGKAFAQLLMQMKNLKKCEIKNLDYHDKRSGPLVKELEKHGRADLLTDNLREIVSY